MPNKLFTNLFAILVSLLIINPAFAQEKRLSGKVYDERGIELPGVSVSIKNTKIGVITDSEGKFALNAPLGSQTLVFSFLGMEEQEVPIGNKLSFQVSLKMQITTLSDVIVIGYGTVNKSDLTGSVSRITREDLIKDAPVNILQSLQGKISGVNVTQNDGAPGAGLSIRIRGSNSFLGGTEPLYVIDGVPFNNNSSGSTPLSIGEDEKQTLNAMSFLNPSDIESIDVLKDASATAIYGSRGANGVVLITTRKGKTGKDKIETNFIFGQAEVSKRLDVLNASEYAEYQNLAYQNSNKYTGTSSDFPSWLISKSFSKYLWRK
jgi:TonB-dependent SusC/RagA subfamily outer membrane receptor